VLRLETRAPGEREGLGFGKVQPRREDLRGLALPAGAVDHRLAVRREAGPVHDSSAERELAVGRHRLALEPPACDDGCGERGEHGGHEGAAGEPCLPGSSPLSGSGYLPAPGRGCHLQGQREVVPGLEAPLGVLLETPLHDPVEPRRRP